MEKKLETAIMGYIGFKVWGCSAAKAQVDTRQDVSYSQYFLHNLMHMGSLFGTMLGILSDSTKHKRDLYVHS